MRERDVRVRGKKPSQVFPEHVHAFLNSLVYTRAFEFPDFTNNRSLAFPPRLWHSMICLNLNLSFQVATDFLFDLLGIPP